jgi:hypothetical protein
MPKLPRSTETTIKIERRMVVAELPISDQGDVHPLIAIGQEGLEQLHQAWSRDAVAGGSTGMDRIEDVLEATYGRTRMRIEFEPVERDR